MAKAPKGKVKVKIVKEKKLPAALPPPDPTIGFRRRKALVHFTETLKVRFLQELAKTGLFCRTATSLGISTTSVYNHMEEDKQFAQAVELAKEIYRESLEKEAHRRAVEGVTRSIYYQGEKIGELKEYSDRLMELMLKRHIPEYRDKISADVTMRAGILVVPMNPPSVEDWAATYGKPPAGASVPGLEKSNGKTEDENHAAGNGKG